MKNFTLRYTGEDAVLNYSFRGVVVQFSKDNNYVINLMKYVADQTIYSAKDSEFMGIVKNIYSELISKEYIEPYLDMEDAKDLIIDARNNSLISEMELKHSSSIEKLSKEKGNKVKSIDAKADDQLSKLTEELNKDASKAFDVVEAKKASMKSMRVNMETDNKLQKKEIQKDFNEQQSKLLEANGAYTKTLNESKKEIEKLQESFNNQRDKVQAEYDKLISKLRDDNDDEMSDLVSLLVASREREIKAINSIVSGKIMKEVIKEANKG